MPGKRKHEGSDEKALEDLTNIGDNSTTAGADLPKQKKKRIADPGVRVQGGRIYDSKTGTTCHQCRQKTVEVKAKCGSCTLWWCPACLLNRYGEEVDKVNKVEGWKCPRCRGLCNCSNCRKKRGLEATGILASMSKAAGFSSVSDLLQKNPQAKRPQSASADPSQPKEKKAPKKDPGGKSKARPSEQSAQQQPNLLDDSQLPKSKVSMPAGVAPRVHRPAGKGVRWPRAWPAVVALPGDCCASDLIEILETLQIFSAQMRVPADILACAAAELLQPYDPAKPSACSRDSPTALIHMRLLDLVRQDWGIKESVGPTGWQAVMRQYLRQDRQAAAVLTSQGDRSPPASPPRQAEPCPEGGAAAGAVLSPVTRAAEQGQSGKEDDLMAYPEGGYWAVAPGARLRMLRALCCDALDTAIIRQRIDDGFDAAVAEDKKNREKAAAARREAKEARQKQRDAEVGLLLAGGPASGLTIAEQMALLQQAKAQAEAAEPDQAEAAALPPAVRVLPLGEDRRGALYWKLPCSAIMAGCEAAVLTAQEWVSIQADNWVVHTDPAAVCAALDGRGRKESALLQKLQTCFGLPGKDTASHRKIRV